MIHSSKFLVLAILSLPVLAIASSSADLHPVADVDMANVDCGCTFRSMSGQWSPMPDATTRTLIVLDVNAEPPSAHINLGTGDIVLRPETELAFPLYDCAVDEKFRSVWVSDTHELAISASITRPGQAGCWLSGIAAVKWDDHSRAVPVTGSCGW